MATWTEETWSYATQDYDLLIEDTFKLLIEGDYYLLIDGQTKWDEDTKNTATWTELTKS